MTSFLDGEGRQGATLEMIGGGFAANNLKDSAGDNVAGDNRQRIASFTLHPIYVSKLEVLGGYLGIDALIPILSLRNDFTTGAGSSSGLGDITVSPHIQWINLELWGRPFAMRISPQIVAPTGRYSPSDFANVGQNVWQISPYYAFTWRATDQWEISGRFIYDWSSVNRRPPTALQAASAQPGDQFAFNLSASYAISQEWRIGVASYGLQQLGETRVNGQSVPGSRQRVFGAGPGILWMNTHSTIIANIFREFAAENRPEGYQAILRLIVPY